MQAAAWATTVTALEGEVACKRKTRNLQHLVVRVFTALALRWLLRSPMVSTEDASLSGQ